jgi:hypothetical protein
MSKMKEQTLEVNLTAKASPDPAQTTLQVPKICSFKGVRQEVMNRVWKDAAQLEDQGIPLDYGAFGYLIRKHWDEVKKEQQKACPVFNPTQIEHILSKS